MLYAGTCGGHVYNGRDVEELACNMAAVDCENPLDLGSLELFPGHVTPRNSRGWHIKNTEPCSPGTLHSLEDLITQYRSRRILEKAKAIEKYRSEAERMVAAAREANEVGRRNRRQAEQSKLEEEARKREEERRRLEEERRRTSTPRGGYGRGYREKRWVVVDGQSVLSD